MMPPVATAAAGSASRFRRVRRERADETAQDYVEEIASLIEAGGEARAVDIARVLGVTHATVVRVVARLQRLGLVQTRPYRSIFLTESGRTLAKKSRDRHEVVLQFLLGLGISRPVAEADAEGIEHHVSLETLRAMRQFTPIVPGAPLPLKAPCHRQTAPKAGSDLLKPGGNR